jgi:hypothetical protein
MSEWHKGKLLRFCRECKRKRYCTKISIPNHNYQYTCSKGHSWKIEGVTIERVYSALNSIFLPAVKDMFTRDDIFFKRLSRK